MNPAASKHLSKVDKVLARVIRQVGPVNVTPPKGTSPFMSLVRAVAHQQLTGKAANTILGRVLALYPGVPAQTVQELIALARAKPHMLNYASAGPATLAHLAGALFEKMAGIELTHVPYRS